MAELTRTFARKLGSTGWGSAVYAAIVAAAVFIILQMIIAGVIQGLGAWAPVRMIAAIALGQQILPEVGPSLWVVVVAFFIHLWLSIMTAWIVAPIIEGMAMLKAVAIGAAAGLVIYLVNFFLLTATAPWFIELRGWATLINHLIFGAVLAWAYIRRRQTVYERRLATF